MEDVNISKYRASVVREGSKPASPGFVVSEGQSPTDPAGSGQNHLPVTIAPISTALAITENQVLSGAGTVAQYIRGDGSLADFPESSGGGSSVSYYLNGSVNQGTIGGVAYKELNKVPILGAGTDFSINANGYIASFITDAGDPNLLEIPGGNWNFETYFSASSSGGTPTFYVELYKVSGTTATLIASSVTSPEFIAFGTNLTPYFSSLAVPTTTLALTDRLAVRYYVTHSGRTITMHTENNHLCQIITTFTTGLTALNGLTAQVQNFAVGTSGTDFNIASATATHTFNLPTASATNRGALSSGDWTTFNNKENAITAGTTAQYFRGDKTFQTLNTSVVPELTNLYYTEARVNANANVAANTAARHNAVTLGTANGLSLNVQQLSLGLASAGVTGALSGTDWSTFNSKQQALNGTGFVKISGTTISYDNSTYLTGNQTITLSGVVTGSGTTAITTAIANGAITNAMLANSSFFIGTTSIALGRASAAQTLTGVNIDGDAGSVDGIDSSRIVFGENSTATTSIGEASIQTALKSGFYTVSNSGLGHIPTATSVNFLLHTAFAGIGNLAGIDLLTNDSTSSELYYRNATGGGKGPWRTILHSANFNSYAPTLGGTGATGTWSIAITGNAGTANTWTTARTITIGNTGKSVNGSADVAWSLAEIGAYAATNPSAFIALTALSGVAPIQYNNSTGAISITQASGSTNGFLSSTDWTTFNNKQNALTNPVTGSGTTNYLPKFTGTSTIGNSIVAESGNSIGIGTAAPQTYTNYSVLEINNTIGGAIRVKNTAATGLFELATNVNETYIKNVSNTPIWFGTNNIERLRLDANGNLGLGITPSAWGSSIALQIGSRTSITSVIDDLNLTNNAFYNGSNWIYLTSTSASNYYQSAGNHVWRIAPSGTAGNAISFTQAMTLDASGNLLIGATSNISSARREIVIRGANGSLLSLGNNTTADRFQIVSDSGENALLNNKASTPMIFYTSNTERARFTSGGNLLVGTTTDNGARLQVSGISSLSGNVTIFTAGYPYIDLGINSSNYWRIINDNPNDTFLIQKNASTILTISGGGAATFSSSVTALGAINVGSAGSLQINAGSAATPLLTQSTNYTELYRRSGGVGIYLGGTGDPANYYDNTSHFFRSSGGGSNYVTINPNGNFGIGTTSIPSSNNKIVVQGNGNTNTDAILIFNNNFNANSYTAIGSYFANGNTNVYSQVRFGNETFTGGGAFLAFATGNTEAMRISSGGNVLIRTTTDVGARLHVNGDIRTAAPSGGSAVNWKLGTARGGTITPNAIVRVEIDGVLVDLDARYV